MTQYAVLDGSEIAEVIEASPEQYAALLDAGIAASWIETPGSVSNATHYYSGGNFVEYTAGQAAAKAAKPTGYAVAWNNATFAWEDVTDLDVRKDDAVRSLRAKQSEIVPNQDGALRRVVLAIADSAAPDTDDLLVLAEAESYFQALESSIASVKAAASVAGVAAASAPVSEPTGGWWPAP